MTARTLLLRTVLAAVALLVASCSCGVDGVVAPTSGDGAAVCSRLEPLRSALIDKHLTVTELLTKEGTDGVGLRAMVALIGPKKADPSGRFRPSLEYLADRWEAESLDGAAPREPSPDVIENARELDRFLADGGCG